MTKHTPGPWTIETPMGEETPWIVEAGKQSYEWRCIAIVPVKPEDEDDLLVPEARANLRLISAAPDLLAAILNSDDAHWTPAMRAAIKKATGASLKTAE